jgi:hypothetical protein
VETHPSCLSSEKLLDQCEITRQRRSGPGGQHRNKVETAIRLRFRPTGTTSEASERRSQAANQSAATFRLRLNLALEVRTRPATGPSELWRSRCRNGALAVNVDHDDFPALLAEALDHLSAAEWNLQQAADRLGCTATQLTKLLRKHPPALAILNRHRAAAGLSPLR